MHYKIVSKIFYTKCRTCFRATEHAAAFDLYACIDDSIPIHPGAPAQLIPTGLAFDLLSEPVPHVGLLFLRSSLSLMGFSLANGVGLIDPDYQGEVKAPIVNNTNELLHVLPGQRFAQIFFMPFHASSVELELVKAFASKTERDTGGFGHTDQLTRVN